MTGQPEDFKPPVPISLLTFFKVLCAGWLLHATGFGPARASDKPRRVVSLNVCTDQLLLALADPDQIAGVSLFAQDPSLSFLTAAASRFRAVRPSAEEVLKLAPDLVLASAFTRPQTRELLQRYRVRVEAFAPVLTIAEAQAEITRAAALLGVPERGAALSAGIDRALTEAVAASSRQITGLQLQRRGFASGAQTLVADIMSRVGIANAGERLGITSVERVPLEAILKLKPDMLIVDGEGGNAPDQGSALLKHPALAAAVPVSRRAVLPLNQITCGGPAVAAAIRTLSSEAARIRAGLAAIR